MNIWGKIDESINSLEELLNIKVTIVDREGVFHDEQGVSLFPLLRKSHRKIRICDMGFCPQCIQHCRYEMNAKGETTGAYFFSRCWKGVMEVVVPIAGNGIHLGSFFAGTWRDPERLTPDNSDLLPNSARKVYADLPPFDYVNGEKLGKVLSIFVQGLVVSLNQIKHLDEFQSGRTMRIRQYLFRNASGSATLNDLAAELCLSPSRTSHLVKELFGSGFQELLMTERINRAKTLLVSTEDSVQEIAYKVGISDEYYFNKIFRKRIGLPPGKFRRNH